MQNQPNDKKLIDRARRRRTLKKAYIYNNVSGGNKPCVLRNISETGALLRFETTCNIPDEFILGIELDGIERPAKFIRLDGDQIGAQFIGDKKEIKPLRRQAFRSDDGNTFARRRIDILKKDAELEKAQPLLHF